MKILIWIAIAVAIVGFGALFVSAMKRSMRAPDREPGGWGNINSDRAGSDGGDWGSRD